MAQAVMMEDVGSRRRGDGREDSSSRSTDSTNSTNTEKRGVKRHADMSNLSDEQRFTKRFNLLSLGKQQHPQHRPASFVSDRLCTGADTPPHSSSHAYIPLQDGEPATSTSRSPLTSSHNTVSNAASGSSMDVDDTKSRIFIGDLDAEIADIDAHQPEPRLIFLPDIEKHFSRLPRQVLADDKADRARLTPADQQLVLYNVPQSLTVDNSTDDPVRRVIEEAKRRTRDRAKEFAREEDMKRKYASPDNTEHAVETAHGYGAGYAIEPELDTDAMDLE